MRPDVSILTSGHDVADARLHREVAALRRAGLAVEVLGLGEAGDGPDGAQVSTRARRGPVGRALLAAGLGWRARGRVLMTLDPDSAVATWPAARVRRRPLVVDVHEDYAALLRDRAWARGPAGRVAAVLVRVADLAARRADLTVVADEHVPPATARRRHVLRNLPDTSMIPEPVAPEPVPRAVYIGDVRASRGGFAMVEAIAAAPGWTLDVIGPVAPADAAALQRRVAAPDVAGRVRLHGRMPPTQAWALAAGAWVGLCLLADTPAFRDAVPSKLREYLAAALGVICSDLPRQAAIVRESGAGAVVPAGADCAAATAEVLRGLTADASHRDRWRTAAAAATRAASSGGYDEFAAAVAAVLSAPAAAGRDA